MTSVPKKSALITGITSQYSTEFLVVIPTNLYGPGDNYHPENSYVIPALISKFHQAWVRGDKAVTIWGGGNPQREFPYGDDMADACVLLMNLPDDKYDSLLGSDESKTGRSEPPLVNIGCGTDLSTGQLSESVRGTVGFSGQIVFDKTMPVGTPRKLLDVSRLQSLGWEWKVPLLDGLRTAYLGYYATR